MSGFLLGLGAIVTDVGSWYAERAQLQNGSDAGALATAQSCAKGACDLSIAESKYSGENNIQELDVTNAVTSGFPCGSSPHSSPSLPACPAGTENGTYCPLPPPAGLAYVDVHNNTSASVSPILGHVLDKTDTGKTIHSCAQATWGPAGGGKGLAVTMSLCAWTRATGGTANPIYASPQPPYASASNLPPAYPNATVDKDNPLVANPGGENVVQLTGDEKPCALGPSGQDLPGGFGWLSNDSTGKAPPNCQVSTTTGYVYANGGVNLAGVCGNALRDIYNSGWPIPNSLNPILIPVFDMACSANGKLLPAKTDDCPSGMQPSQYHIAGYASFVLTGYDINPEHAGSLKSGSHYCDGGGYTCLYGFFMRGLVQSTGDFGSGGTDFGGPSIIKLTG